MKFIYQNWSTGVFEGFYESLLYNSDSVLNMVSGEPEPPEGYYYDVCDFSGFENEVGAEARRLIWNAIPDEDEIVKDMQFVGISSPRFYNYSTDRIEMEVDVNVDNLCKYCLSTNREKFNEYLKENFTSFSGFHSFVENNADEFESNFIEIADSGKAENELTRYLNVMLEFYILRLDYMKSGERDFSPYLYDLMEFANYALWDRLCLYCEKDGKYYQYTLDSTESKVIIGDSISSQN